MADPYVGQIILTAFDFAPTPNYAVCNGNVVSIAQYNMLYALIGTTYGGDGVSTFKLPDLQARLCVGQGTLPGGNPYPLGQSAGMLTVTLTENNLPAHQHTVVASKNAGNTGDPLSTVLAVSSPVAVYDPMPAPGPTKAEMNANTVGVAGTNAPQISNVMPSLALLYSIAVNGTFPSRP